MLIPTANNKIFKKNKPRHVYDNYAMSSKLKYECVAIEKTLDELEDLFDEESNKE